ncbi:Essential recombination function protein [uncultured Caudovirales phage]|uniref:Essential recombination function protein n=1 Tax=uncultured Caudovirales phage TaxID=2100421 RepID=A0A6J5M2D0_9CAUD|nr:Essential recombination function protein [uncultured Caudovirales phage]CAB4157211.1 Essential recombination function protein [uncultured Caudovirales phage]
MENFEVYAKLQKCRVELQNMELKKSGHNKFAGYRYFELGDILPAINTLFDIYGLCYSLQFDRDMANMFIVDVATGNSIKFCCPMESAILKGCQPVQNLGGSISYISRYLLVMALAVSEHDAVDASEPLKEKKATISATDGAREALDARLGSLVDKLAAHIQAQFDAGNEWAAFEAWDLRDQKTFDETATTAVWSQLSSKCKSTLKLMAKEANGESK